ncbi:phosphoprotein [Belerina virus]|uniref:Phosphoprotein n=1 Tax=Belerina virus TaxID=2748342 RepID=A0A7D5HJ27_9MONO|nr:phosphoprotein [Belerina virus]QKZ93213.1 phosphoprotein [Belerina virus]
MFKASELNDLVDNGLKTVEFLQKVKEVPAPTYGRSAIGGPKSRERIEAWEKYLQSGNEFIPRSADTTATLQDAEERSSKHHPSRDQEAGGTRAEEGNTPSKPVSDRNRQGRDAENHNDERQGNWSSNQSTDNRSAGNGSTDTEGSPESKVSDTDGTGVLYASTGLDEERGSSVPHGGRASRSGRSSITELSTEDMDAIISGPPRKQNRRVQSLETIEETILTAEIPKGPIKKGIDGRSQSMSMEGRQLSENGVSPSAAPSSGHRPSEDVSAGNVQPNVTSVEAQAAPLLPVDPTDLSSKIDDILGNQAKILTRLNVLTEIKEEIMNVKKILTNHSLALSTLESYINDLMIIIPAKGRESGPQSTELNQDLKAVIGRDNRRGLADEGVLSKKFKEVRMGEDIFNFPVMNGEMILESIDKDKNHAAHFIPSNDSVSMTVIKRIIYKQSPNRETADDIWAYVKEARSYKDLKEIKNDIEHLLSEINGSNQ